MIGDSHTDHLMLSLVSVWPWLTAPLRRLAEFVTGTGLLKFMGYLEVRIAAMRRALSDGSLPSSSSSTSAHHAPVSMMQAMIEAQRDEREGKTGGKMRGVTDWDVLSSMASNLAAGSDTTAVAMGVTVFHLYRDPARLARLRRELEGAGLPERPRLQDVQKLPYLQAVIKEGLRLAPGFGLPLWREVPKGGAVLSGQFFPEGVGLSLSLSFSKVTLLLLHLHDLLFLCLCAFMLGISSY